MQHTKAPYKFPTNWFWAICILSQFCVQANAQSSIKKIQDSPQQKKIDTSKSLLDTLLDFNNSKLVKKANAILDSTQKKATDFILNKVNKLKGAANDKANKIVGKVIPQEIEKPLPYERLLNTKYTLGRRAYQNTVSQFNFLFNAEEELNENKLGNHYNIMSFVFLHKNTNFNIEYDYNEPNIVFSKDELKLENGATNYFEDWISSPNITSAEKKMTGDFNQRYIYFYYNYRKDNIKESNNIENRMNNILNYL